jgi:hypothetical protein
LFLRSTTLSHPAMVLRRRAATTIVSLPARLRNASSKCPTSSATKFTRYSIPVQVLDYSVSDGHTRNDPLAGKLKFHINSVVLAQLIEQFPFRCF